MITEQQNIDPSQFGKDHWSLLMYVLTRCLDYQGMLDRKHLRDKSRTFGEGKWQKNYGTKIYGFYDDLGTISDPSKVLEDHDDYDCLNDLIVHDFIEQYKAGHYKLIKKGYLAAIKIIEHKTLGNQYASFVFRSQTK